jgi:uroporphyrinogen decarboxylase
MNSKQRVHAALRHQPVDRVPIFMWYHPATAQAMAESLEIPVDLLPLAVCDDIHQRWIGNNYAMEGITHPHEGEGHRDCWGIDWVREGAFNQIVKSPLQDASAEALQAYQWPCTQIDTLLEPMKPILPLADEYFIGCDISPCIFELYVRLRGMDQALLDLLDQPETTADFLGACSRFEQQLAEAACTQLPLDWLWLGDDAGSQAAMLMSPRTWRQLVKPRLAEIINVARRHQLPVAFHSCGAIRPIIPDLIEIGVNVLNPLQGNCPGMNPAELKQEFGDKLAFMGGLDTQQLLPHGSATEVRRATENLIETMTSDGGGYILAAAHTIPPETPLANIFAMYEAAGVSRQQIMDQAASLRAMAH